MDQASSTVKLRSISEDDLSFWRELISQPETREHQPLQERTEEELRQHLHRYTEHDLGHPHHREYKWVVIDTKSLERVGEVSFDKLDIGQKIGRIGYSVHPQCWGKGFGTVAVGVMVDKIFSESDCQRIEAECSIHNPASSRVLEKYGFTREGTKRGYLEIYDVRVDHHSFGLLREDWEEQR